MFQEILLPGFGLEKLAQFDPERPKTDLCHVVFYYVRDVPELLIMRREREYFTWWVFGCGRAGLTPEDRFIKNEAYNPTKIDDDAVEEYVSKTPYPQ